jgi:hypothetical protein
MSVKVKFPYGNGHMDNSGWSREGCPTRWLITIDGVSYLQNDLGIANFKTIDDLYKGKEEVRYKFPEPYKTSVGVSLDVVDAVKHMFKGIVDSIEEISSGIKIKIGAKEVVYSVQRGNSGNREIGILVMGTKEKPVFIEFSTWDVKKSEG